MTTENRVLWAQLLGLIAIIGARFGIEISAEAQTDILAGLSAFGLVLTAVIAKARVKPDPDPIQYPPNDEAGRALPGLLLALGLAAVLLVSLSGCGLQPATPAHAITASSVVIEQLANEIGTAQLLGQITVEREAMLLDRLQVANDTLRQAQALYASGGDAAALLERASTELSRIRSELANQEPHP